MKTLTPWTGAGDPPAGDVLVPDVFGFPFMPAGEGVASEQSMQAVASVFARIAACPDQTFWLATEHFDRAREWFDLVHRSGFKAPCPPDYIDFTREWPLPNLTLLSRLDDLDALLELPAARNGAVASSAEGAARLRHRRQACVAGHCVDINGDWWHEPGKCPGAPMNCSGKCCYADPGAVFLSGDWWRCSAVTDGQTCRDGVIYLHEAYDCPVCHGSGLSPEATALVELCRAAGVEVARG